MYDFFQCQRRNWLPEANALNKSLQYELYCVGTIYVGELLDHSVDLKVEEAQQIIGEPQF